MVPIEYLKHEAALKALDFVEGGDCIFRKGILQATIEGRVITFTTERSACTVFASLDFGDFEPRDVLELYYKKNGIRSISDAYAHMVKSTENYEAVQCSYADDVADHFIACGVPVQYCEVNGYSSFRVDPEIVRGPEPVDLFRIQVRHDFGMEFFLEGDNSVVVDGDDPVRNIGEVFSAASSHDLLVENPSDRVDYSSTYHYRYIVNALPDMLRVGIKKVRKETVEIVTALSKPITNCKKHFHPEVIGTITDYCVDFKRSIHPPTKWND